MDWISVKDKLPEVGEPVLAFRYRFEIVRLCDIPERGGLVWNDYDDYKKYEDINYFSHWFPIPNKPEGWADISLTWIQLMEIVDKKKGKNESI